MKPNVLHVFKKDYKLPRHLYLGATKDIRGRTEYFQTRGIDYVELLPEFKDQYYNVIKSLPESDMHRYSAVIFETTFSPLAVRLIKKKFPHITVMVRSHNAELLHRLDWARTQGISIGTLRSLKNGLKNSLCDYYSGKWADYVISISRWESDNYWTRIASKSKFKCVPFFLPNTYVAEMPVLSIKKKQCVNFTASSPNPLITDAAKNFIAAVKKLDNKYNDWTFCITGDQTKYDIKTPDRIKWTGFLEKPYDTLAESQAMALLSDYGYGFKTKILEAILAKTYVLMTKGLYGRMPDEVLPYCKPVDINSPDSFKDALAQCMLPYPEGNPNEEFRKQAFAALDGILLK